MILPPSIQPIYEGESIFLVFYFEFSKEDPIFFVDLLPNMVNYVT